MINRYFRLLISQKERIRMCIALQCVFRGSRQVYGDWGNTTGREVKTRDHRQEGDSATLNTLMPYWPSFSQQWGLTIPHSTASSGAKKNRSQIPWSTAAVFPLKFALKTSSFPRSQQVNQLLCICYSGQHWKVLNTALPKYGKSSNIE